MYSKKTVNLHALNIIYINIIIPLNKFPVKSSNRKLKTFFMDFRIFKLKTHSIKSAD